MPDLYCKILPQEVSIEFLFRDFKEQRYYANKAYST